MASKKELLANLRDYSPKEIADAVKAGEVTLYELGKYSGGQFTPLVKREVKALLEQIEPQAEIYQSEATPAPIKMVEPSSVVPPVTSQAPIPPVTSTPHYTSAPAYTSNSAEQQTWAPGQSVSYGSADPLIEVFGATPQPSTTPISGPPFVPPAAPQASTHEPPYGNNESAYYNTNEEGPKMFSRCFSFRGRINRTEYFLAYLINIVVSSILFLLLYFIPVFEGLALVLWSVFSLSIVFVASWFSLAEGCKRCHDANYSGWYMLIPFFSYALFFIKGDEYPNQYGACPQ